MKNTRATIALLLGALLAGTATAATAGTVSPPKPTKAGNQQLAGTEAASLLSLAPASLPAGASALTAQPARLIGSGPAMGTPSDQTRIIRTDYWSIAGTASATLAYVQSHPPQGLSPYGTSSSFNGTVETDGNSWSAASSAAWATAWLEFAVTSDGAGGSLVRVDAVVVWLDPTPVKDGAHGKRVHLSVTGGCPTTIKAVGVHNAGNDLRSNLIPETTPTAGLVCSYGSAGKLTRHHTLSRSAAGKVAKAARALPLAHTDGGFTACPADFGTFAVIALRFPHRPDVDLWLDPSGCSYVTNGLIGTAAGTLASVAGVPRSPASP